MSIDPMEGRKTDEQLRAVVETGAALHSSLDAVASNQR
jgi:hypothetical protein